MFAALAWGLPSKATSDVPVVSTKVTSAEERATFLKNLGYEIEAEPLEVREVRIPDEPDDVLKQYNELQKQTGWDLEPYLGKRIKLYTYRVLNGETEDTRAYLCVYRNTVIAGHVAVNGEQQALIRS